MGVEIERKFLVKNSDYRSMATDMVEIAQAYLCRRKESTVRVRVKGDRGYITVKGVTSGAVRGEWEYEIPVADAREMLSIADGAPLDKRRYLVPYEGLVWEVDEFGGAHQGLVIAEVELPSADAHVKLPPFVGKEVTGDARYYNSNL